MRRPYLLLVMILTIVTATIMPGFVRSAPALAGVETLRPTDGAVSNPVTDGEWVVWREAETPFAKTGDLRAGLVDGTWEPVTIAEDIPGLAYAIENGTLVWAGQAETEGSVSAVYATELDSGETVELAPIAGGTVTSIAISWPVVAWSVTDSTGDTVWWRLLNVDDPPVVGAHAPAESGSSIQWVAAWADILVWSRTYMVSTHTRAWELRAVSILGCDPCGDPIILASGYDDVSGPGVYTTGIRMAAFGAGNNELLYSDDLAVVHVDIAYGTVETLADTSSYWSPGRGPSTDGRWAAWNDYRFTTDPLGDYTRAILEGTPLRQDIWAHDLYTGAQFPVTVDTGDNELGGIGAGVITWVRFSDDRSDATLHILRVRDVLPTAPLPDGIGNEGQSYFSQTGHYLGWGFRDYWNASGGLPVFGYPMTEEYPERNQDTGTWHTVQFTERQRFEWHPDNWGTPYLVLLARLGDELLRLQGVDWTTLATADPNAPHYFAETGHAIAPEFWEYWSTHGLEFGDAGVSFRESLALFGYPLSEPTMVTNGDGDTVLTQYFERAVFEHHPDNPEPHKVLLRRLGWELLISRSWSTTLPVVRE